MGFAKKLITPKIPTVSDVQTPPPTVASDDTTPSTEAYEQQASRRKGLLSTVLSRGNQASGTKQSSTLG